MGGCSSRSTPVDTIQDTGRGKQLLQDSDISLKQQKFIDQESGFNFREKEYERKLYAGKNQDKPKMWIENLKINLITLELPQNNHELYINILHGSEEKHTDSLEKMNKIDKNNNTSYYQWSKPQSFEFEGQDDMIYFQLQNQEQFRQKQGFLSIGAVSLFNILMMMREKDIKENKIIYNCQFQGFQENMNGGVLKIEIEMNIEPTFENNEKIINQNYDMVEGARMLITFVEKPMSSLNIQQGSGHLGPIIYTKYRDQVHITAPAIEEGSDGKKEKFRWNEDIVILLTKQKEKEFSSNQNMLIIRIQDFGNDNSVEFTHFGFMPVIVNSNEVLTLPIRLFARNSTQEFLTVDYQFFPNKSEFFLKNNQEYLRKNPSYPTQGQNRFEYQNGDVYNGEWRDCKRNGKGQCRYLKNSLVYSGGWKDNEYHGLGVLKIEFGQEYRGFFINGQKQGYAQIIMKDINENIYTYRGGVKNDNLHGLAKLTFPNSQTKDCLFKDGYFQKWIENLEEIKSRIPDYISVYIVDKEKNDELIFLENISRESIPMQIKDKIVEIQGKMNNLSAEEIQKNKNSLQNHDLYNGKGIFFGDRQLEEDASLMSLNIQNNYVLHLANPEKIKAEREQDNQEKISKGYYEQLEENVSRQVDGKEQENEKNSGNKDYQIRISSEEKSHHKGSEDYDQIKFSMKGSLTQSDILAKQQEIQQFKQRQVETQGKLDQLLLLMKNQQMDIQQLSDNQKQNVQDKIQIQEKLNNIKENQQSQQKELDKQEQGKMKYQQDEVNEKLKFKQKQDEEIKKFNNREEEIQNKFKQNQELQEQMFKERETEIKEKRQREIEIESFRAQREAEEQELKSYRQKEEEDIQKLKQIRLEEQNKFDREKERQMQELVKIKQEKEKLQQELQQEKLNSQRNLFEIQFQQEKLNSQRNQLEIKNDNKENQKVEITTQENPQDIDKKIIQTQENPQPYSSKEKQEQDNKILEQILKEQQLIKQQYDEQSQRLERLFKYLQEQYQYQSNSKRVPQIITEKQALLQDTLGQIPKQLEKTLGINLEITRVTTFPNQKILQYEILLSDEMGIVLDDSKKPVYILPQEQFHSDPIENAVYVNQVHHIRLDPLSYKDNNKKTYTNLTLIIKLNQIPDLYMQQTNYDTNLGHYSKTKRGLMLIEQKLDKLRQKEECLGWIQFPLFDEHGRLKAGNYSSHVFLPPLPKKVPHQVSFTDSIKTAVFFSIRPRLI